VTPCDQCGERHPHAGEPLACVGALRAEVARLRNKVADQRGDLERIRRERDRALGKAPAPRASPSTQEAP
jgi:hypothetical protein